MRIVEVGQYFMTKDTGDFRQFRSVACREYTLPRDDTASQPKRWIQGNMRIGPVLEVTTSFQNFKHGIEIRIWSVGQDNSQSWVRISYGTNKYVIDSNHYNAEILADPHEDQTSQTSVKVITAVRYTFIQIAKKKNSSQNTFIQKHFHPKPFHPKEKTISSTTLSSKNGFIQ